MPSKAPETKKAALCPLVEVMQVWAVSGRVLQQCCLSELFGVAGDSQYCSGNGIFVPDIAQDSVWVFLPFGSHGGEVLVTAGWPCCSRLVRLFAVFDDRVNNLGGVMVLAAVSALAEVEGSWVQLLELSEPVDVVDLR